MRRHFANREGVARRPFRPLFDEKIIFLVSPLYEEALIRVISHSDTRYRYSKCRMYQVIQAERIKKESAAVSKDVGQEQGPVGLRGLASSRNEQASWISSFNSSGIHFANVSFFD